MFFKSLNFLFKINFYIFLLFWYIDDKNNLKKIKNIILIYF